MGLSLYALLVLFCIVLAICWIILPFAVIGTKPLLAKLLEEQRQTNQLLREMVPPQQVARPSLRKVMP